MNTSLSKPRAAGWTIATVLAPLAIYFVLSSFYIGLWYARTRHRGPPPSGVIIEAIMVAAPLSAWATVGLWWLIHRRRTAFSKLYATRTETPALDVGLGLAIGAAWVAIYGLFDVVAFGEMFTFSLPKLASTPLSISAGFCEEFLFRGFLFLIIARAGGGWKSQLVYSSLAFGLAHCFWGPWGMLWTTVLGVTFGLSLLWRRNVWPAVVAHAVLNLCIEPALFQKAIQGGFSS